MFSLICFEIFAMLAMSQQILSTSSSQSICIESQSDKIIERYDCEEHSGWLVREYLSTKDQIDLYKYTIDNVVDTKEFTEILYAPPTIGYPIAYNNLVYTGSSNCGPLVRWHELADDVIKLLKSRTDAKFYGFPDNYAFNSTYMHLFGNESKLAAHRDSYITWGASVSIGATAEFTFGNFTIYINSGDIFVTDFSKVMHSIVKIHNNAPEWYNDDNIRTFGRIRAGVQIKSVIPLTEDKVMSTEDFKQMLVSYK